MSSACQLTRLCYHAAMSDLPYNPDDPLARMSGESLPAHQALLDYERLGHERTIERLLTKYRDVPGGAAPPPTRRKSTLAGWSAKHHWLARVAAAHDVRTTRERARNEARWLERREKVREESWELAQKLRARASELLQFPIAEITTEQARRESEDGRTLITYNTVVKPARWSARDIATFAKTFEEMARLAAGMDTEQQRVIVEGLEPDDLVSLSDEEFETLWAKVQAKKKR